MQLVMAYRSLSRPSSFRNAQASAVCPYSLDLLFSFDVWDTAYPTACFVRFVSVAYYACLIFLASGRIFGVDLTSAQNLNFHGLSRKSSSCDLRYFRFILICLGKSFSEDCSASYAPDFAPSTTLCVVPLPRKQGRLKVTAITLS